MLTPSIPQFRRRRGRASTNAVAANLLTITQVTVGGGGSSIVRITFAGPVTWNGSDVPAAFSAFTEDGLMDPCVNVNATGPDWIDVEFNANVLPGAAWELNGAMAGITPAVAWPQSGTVS